VLNEDMTRRLARTGLTVSRAGVLWRLRDGGPTTQRALADALGVSARTMTGLIDGLVATGFVTRQPHPTDRRATLVTFTAKGTRVVRTLEGEQATFTRDLFAELPGLDRFVAGLDHVLAAVRRVPASGPRRGGGR
jgi:DNA-binding MarR family transcriptional regulator